MKTKPPNSKHSQVSQAPGQTLVSWFGRSSRSSHTVLRDSSLNLTRWNPGFDRAWWRSGTVSMNLCVTTGTNFPPSFFFMCHSAAASSSPPPAHVHRLNVAWAGPSRWLTVGTATSPIRANICCTTRGHLEWALIPTQPCCGGKHSFLLLSAGKQGKAVLRVNLRATGLSERTGMLSVTWPPIVPRPIMAVQRGVTASVGSGLVQLDGFGFWG